MASRAVPKSPRVFAMARPSRCAEERALVEAAMRELQLEGSGRVRARALALEVARLAIVHVRQSDDDFGEQFELRGAHLAMPCVAALATDPGIDTAAIVVAEAVRQFEANGCRHADPTATATLDAALAEAVAARLARRYRRGAK